MSDLHLWRDIAKIIRLSLQGPRCSLQCLTNGSQTNQFEQMNHLSEWFSYSYLDRNKSVEWMVHWLTVTSHHLVRNRWNMQKVVTRGLYHDGRWTNSELYDTFWVDKTKPLQSGFVGPMKLLINFLCQVRVDPVFVEHEQMYVWHHWRTANHEPWLKVLLKVKRLKNMINWNVLVHERGQIQINYIALSVQSQVQLVKLVYIVVNIQR